MSNALKTSSGMTLAEVLVGFCILMIAAVPLLSLYLRMAHSETVQDERVAYALLRGETEIMYQKNKLPESEKTFSMNGKSYRLCCNVTKKDGKLTEWALNVDRGKKEIARLSGLLYCKE